MCFSFSLWCSKKTADGKAVSKCDLYVDYGKPLCVESCPNNAIKLLNEDGAEALK
jgi:carbon-monoxide dehydrogenase iron sulfur subunit